MHKYYKMNYILLFADTILFVFAMSFLSINAVIPYFLNSLNVGTFEISLASALVSIGTFISQPIFARKAMGLKVKKKAFVKILLTQRLFFLAYVALMPLISSQGNRIAAVVFLLCWGIFSFFIGSYSPFFMSIMPKMIPENHRGRLLGFAGAVGNITGIGAAYIVSLLLKNVAFPYNYVYIFGIGTIFLIIDALDFAIMKEPPDEIIQKGTGYFQYFRDIPIVLKNNKIYAKMVLGNAFFVISNISLAYYALYAIRKFNAGAEGVGLFTALTVIANTVGSIAFGVIADRFGYKRVLQISSASGVIAALVVLTSHNMLGVYTAFVLSSLCSCGYLLSNSVYIVQLSPKGQIPVRVSINAMITLIISSIVTLLSGFVIDIFSFKPIFIMTGISSLAAFLVYYFLNSKNYGEGKEV